jgi:transposase InsO family protein
MFSKRVYRLWRQEGLNVPEKKGKRQRLGDSENGCLRRKAEHINRVWSYDFVSDQTADGRRLKLLVVLDAYTRESLTVEDYRLRYNHRRRHSSLNYATPAAFAAACLASAPASAGPAPTPNREEVAANSLIRAGT